MRTDLPPLAEPPEALTLLLADVGEEVSVHHGIQEPLPVLSSDVADEPGVALSVEADLRGEAHLHQEIGYAEEALSGHPWML